LVKSKKKKRKEEYTEKITKLIDRKRKMKEDKN
jgi:hypothetical protein